VVLNWRHEAGLFLALIATACGLLFELSAKQTAGIALLGIALAWLFRSLSLRTIGVTSFLVISALGLYLAVS
jgi:hypothetical protein